mgnify:CR=1 FL=1
MQQRLFISAGATAALLTTFLAACGNGLKIEDNYPVNVPGTDNNYPLTNAAGAPIDADNALTSVSGRPQNGDLAEFTARNAANLAWLEDGFRFAQTHGSKGIMIVQSRPASREEADAYHRWYDACRVTPLAETPVETVHRTRLWLNDAAGVVLRNGLAVLGVSAPERM